MSALNLLPSRPVDAARPPLDTPSRGEGADRGHTLNAGLGDGPARTANVSPRKPASARSRLRGRLDARRGIPGRLQRLCKGFAGVLGGWRTANSADLRLSALLTPNAADISGLENGAWYVIAPYGEHPSPDGSYTQVFSRDQAAKVVSTWNSIAGTAARCFKNCWHGLGPKFSAPVWDGHPETDKDRWPVEKLLGETTELRAGTTGLEGRQTWNAQGMAKRPRGPLYPSPLWWHFPPDAAGRVFPELLESIGLVPTANIASTPAWTQNASPASDPEAVTTTTADQPNDTLMDPKKIREKLGLAAEATEADVIAAIATLQTTANSLATVQTTANAAKVDLETKLNSANGKITELEGKLTTANSALTGEQGRLTTANARVTELETANEALATGVAHGFELAGIVPPSERESTLGKLKTANTAVATVTELKAKKAVVPVKSIELGATRHDISTANARRQVIDDAVTKRMADHKESYDAAYAAVRRDPQFKAVFEAMQDPTKAASAA